MQSNPHSLPLCRCRGYCNKSNQSLAARGRLAGTECQTLVCASSLFPHHAKTAGTTKGEVRRASSLGDCPLQVRFVHERALTKCGWYPIKSRRVLYPNGGGGGAFVRSGSRWALQPAGHVFPAPQSYGTLALRPEGCPPPRSAAVPPQPTPFIGPALRGKSEGRGARARRDPSGRAAKLETRGGFRARPREPIGPLGPPGNRMGYCLGLLIDTELIQPNVRLSTYMHRQSVRSTITAAVNRHPSNTD